MKRLTTIQDIDAYMYQLNETVRVPENTKLIVKLTESEYDHVLETVGSTNFNNGAGMIYNAPTGDRVIIQKIKNKNMTENNIKVLDVKGIEDAIVNQNDLNFVKDHGNGVYEIGKGMFTGARGLEEFDKAV